MWRQLLQKMLALYVIFLLFPSICFAGDLKILDTMGLTRAVKKVNNGAVVKVQTRTATAEVQLRLTHVDGLAADISGSRQNDGSYVFNNVPQGSWRVVVEGQDVAISQVRIE